MAANALVGSGLDYCNSMFKSLSAQDLCKLQCVQNHYQYHQIHITPVGKTLHWLPIEHRSVFKTDLLVYKVYKVVTLHILNLFLKLDTVCIILVAVKLMVWCLRCHTLPHQYISRVSTLAPALHKICTDLPDDVHSATSL